MQTRQSITTTADAAHATSREGGAAENRIVLVLQGGGALGAYQAGVYEALHEAGIEPDWVIGTSIGAINAAIIVGNPPALRMQRLRGFWRTVTQQGVAALWQDLAALWPALPGMPTWWSTIQAVSQGVPGFFTPNPEAWLGPRVPLATDDTGYYSTAELAATLGALIDIRSLNTGAPRLTMGAVNVASGEMHYFDSRDKTLDLRHVLASGALPPAFPPVRIDDDWYWDGGVYSNTPVETVFDDNPRHSSLIFSVQLWRAVGQLPHSMWDVTERQKDIQYASREDSQVQRQAQIHRLRHVVRELAAELPAASRSRPELRELMAYGCSTVMHLMQLIVPRLPDEDHTKDLDFNRDRIEARWQAGLHDGRRTLARKAWRAPHDPMAGLIIHDPGE